MADLNEYLVIKVTNGSTGFTLADNCTTDAVYIVYNLIWIGDAAGSTF